MPNGRLQPRLQKPVALPLPAVKVALPGDRDLERHYLLSIDTVTGETTQIDWPGLVAGAEDFGFFYHQAVVLGGPVTGAGLFAWCLQRWIINVSNC